MALIYPHVVTRAVDRVIYGTGTVIARMAHSRGRHLGLFEACPRCRPAAVPVRGGSLGVLVTSGGRLIETSDLSKRLLAV